VLGTISLAIPNAGIPGPTFDDNVTFNGSVTGVARGGTAICPDGAGGALFEWDGPGTTAVPATPDFFFGNEPTANLALNNLANIKTANAGSFAQSGIYTLSLKCFSGDFTTVTDTYERQINYTAGSPGTFTLVTVAQNTTTTLVAAPTTAEQGADVTLTATVAPAAATGTVEFFNGATSLGTVSTAPYSIVVNTLPVGTNNVTAQFTGAAGFNNSTSAPVAVTVTAVAPRPTTTTIDSVTPLGGDAFVSTTIVCSVDAGTYGAVGTLQFRANGGVLGTVPVTGNGPVSFTTNAIGAGTGIAVDCNFVGTAPYQNSASGQITVDRVLVGATDEQTVIVEIPVGAITITTPYTPDNPLDLGVAVLDQSDSTYSASAAFDRVSISDTRAGELGFTASVVAGPFQSATDTFPGAHAGFEDVTAVQVAGNALQASDVTTTDTVAFAPGIGAPSVFATYPAGTGLGTVEVTALFTLDQVPSSVTPGVYTSTVTFTAL
jgi:hypothetical protein